MKLRYSLLSGALDEDNDDADDDDDDDDGDIDLYYNFKKYISPVEAWPCSFHISVLKKKSTHTDIDGTSNINLSFGKGLNFLHVKGPI